MIGGLMARRWWNRDRKPKARNLPPVPVPTPEPEIGTPTVALPRAAVILLGLAGAAIVVFGIAALRGVVAPVFLALVLTICVHPLRVWLVGIGIKRGVATVTAILAVFALIAGFVALLIISVAQFTTLLPQFAPQIEAAVANMAAALESLGIGDAQVDTILSGLEPQNLVDFATGLLGGIAGIVGTLVVLFTVLMLMVMDATYAPAILTQMQPRRPYLVSALVVYTKSVRRYMVVTTGLGIVQGVLNWIALLVLQVPGALLWGLLSFLCSFIPNIGYFIAIIPPLVFGFLVGGWPTLIAVVVVYGLVNAVVQSIVQPRVVGNAVALSQTITFVSVLFWAVVLGPIGAILAVPLTLLARTVLIDADPKLHLWRPATGDLDDTRPIADQLAATTRADTKAARAARRQAKNGDGTGSDVVVGAVAAPVDDSSASTSRPR
jgi:AI-2 transport protein TqsA